MRNSDQIPIGLTRPTLHLQWVQVNLKSLLVNKWPNIRSTMYCFKTWTQSDCIFVCCWVDGIRTTGNYKGHILECIIWLAQFKVQQFSTKRVALLIATTQMLHFDVWSGQKTYSKLLYESLWWFKVTPFPFFHFWKCDLGEFVSFFGSKISPF